MKKIIPLIASGMMLMTSSAVSAADIYAEADADSAAPVAVSYTAEDLQDLQDFLLAKPSDKDLSGKSYDLNGDGKWDAFDLCLMREKLAEQPNTGGDTIVVYFSRTGNTEKIAEYLIDITGADSYVIEAAEPYSDADIEYNNSDCRANKEQNDKSVRPVIAGEKISLDAYDTVYLGYPIWWGQEPRIIDTFLESYDFSEKTVIPFCTSASSGISTSERNIAALVPIGEQLAGRRFSASASKEDVKKWTESLG